MNEIKKEFRWFSIMDYEKEAEYLNKRQQEGWNSLESIHLKNARRKM
jgi:hypothetical protein